MNHVLEKMHLSNFKCFADHTVVFSKTTIMVGQNNAGKTTVVEALRVLGLATARFCSSKSYSDRPEWARDYMPLSSKGLKISVKVIDTDLEQVFHRYGSPPASIEAFFSDGISIKIYINSEAEMFALFFLNKECVHSYKKIQEIGVPHVRVLPQIVPLQKDEPFVALETLDRNRFSKRTSGNFRNNLYQNRENGKLEELQGLIQSTWGSLRINQIYLDDGEKVYLQMRDSDFVTEIYYMGHGIQMWLQTLWFIVMSEPDSIIVLDEPDVYMHADLQRKLIRILKNNYAQTIIATHSVEIMSEVQPENILIINCRNDVSCLADGYPLIQMAISGMGSIHNISISRLLNDKRYICVEGDDLQILRVFYDTLFPDADEPLDHIPNDTTGGWGSWSYQLDRARKLLNEFPDIKIYYIYDRDYHRQEEIEKRIQDAKNSNVRLHVWDRKEIENYVISCTAIARFVCKKRPELNEATVLSTVSSFVEQTLDCYKDAIIDKTMDEIQMSTKRSNQINASTARQRAIAEIEPMWLTQDSKLKIVPGKQVMSDLSRKCQEQFKVSFNPQQIGNEMNADEIAQEMVETLKAIRQCR